MRAALSCEKSSFAISVQQWIGFGLAQAGDTPNPLFDDPDDRSQVHTEVAALERSRVQAADRAIQKERLRGAELVAEESRKLVEVHRGFAVHENDFVGIARFRQPRVARR